MTEATESMIYEMAFRVRLYIASKFSEDRRLNDLTEREAILLELVGTMGSLSISEIGNFYSQVSSSTISTTITKLWKDKKLVEKKILPENQRITTVNLTEKGRSVLEKIRKNHADILKTVTASLGLTVKQNESFQRILVHAIGHFDKILGLDLDRAGALSA